jgi:hypothetical protein
VDGFSLVEAREQSPEIDSATALAADYFFEPGCSALPQAASSFSNSWPYFHESKRAKHGDGLLPLAAAGAFNWNSNILPPADP